MCLQIQGRSHSSPTFLPSSLYPPPFFPWSLGSPTALEMRKAGRLWPNHFLHHGSDLYHTLMQSVTSLSPVLITVLFSLQYSYLKSRLVLTCIKSHPLRFSALPLSNLESTLLGLFQNKASQKTLYLQGFANL